MAAELRVYVVNIVLGHSSTVNSFRADDLTPIGVKKLDGSFASSLAVNPKNGQVWVTVHGDVEDGIPGKIVVLDPDSLDIIRTITDRDLVHPQGVAYKPPNLHLLPTPSRSKPAPPLVYITGETTGKVGVFNATTYKKIQTIDVGGNPYGIYFLRNGLKAYVLDIANYMFSVVDTSDNRVIDTVPWGGALATLQEGVSSLDSATFYITDRDQNLIHVFNTADTSLVTSLDLGILKPRALGISRDGDYLFVGSCDPGSPAVCMIRISDYSIVSTVPMKSCPRRMVVHPDGNTIFVTDHGSNELVAFTVNTSDLPTFEREPPIGLSFAAKAKTDDLPVGVALSMAKGRIPPRFP